MRLFVSAVRHEKFIINKYPPNIVMTGVWIKNLFSEFNFAISPKRQITIKLLDEEGRRTSSTAVLAISRNCDCRCCRFI